MKPTPPTGAWRHICPAEDPKSAHAYVGALVFEALWRAGEALGLRQTWDAATGKLYQGLPGKPAAPPATPARVGAKLLPVPYYSQLDSVTSQALRMCFSSSCAMLLKFLKPNSLSSSPNADDEYLRRLDQDFGDTTSADAQVATLRHFGVQARFSKSLTWADVDRQLAKGIPVPIGVLHHGPASAPTGGGHWMVVIGRDGTDLIVHDPAGELDVIHGGYLGGSGRAVRYSEKNLTPRWRVNGTGGWGILV